jgi:hypothetical protein
MAKNEYLITQLQRVTIMKYVVSFVEADEAESGLKLEEKAIGVSLFCTLSIHHKQVPNLNDPTDEEREKYLSTEANLIFTTAAESMLKIINQVRESANAMNFEVTKKVERLVES